MNKSKKDYDVYLWSGCAISDENGNFSGNVLSSGVFEVKGEFGDLEEPKALIAAAPEMLAELKMVALGLENTDSGWAKERLGYVNETIAKAEGK
mgnify:FL=1|tara:strand:- start:495 stop:776 length:282 start_codon:yes stop_codon:yes gene_type:complete